MVTRVGTYTRRSTDEDHQPFSIEAQDARLAAYIASQDEWWHDAVCTFSDDRSGYTLDRPGLQGALTSARAGRYDLLLVAKVDRVSRSIQGLTQILDELDAAGVAFRSATEPFDTATPAGRMMVQMLGVFAEFERRMIIDRVVAGMERKAARGEWVVGSIPFGYLNDPKTGHLVPVPSQAPLVPIIFDLYGNKRLGARNIAMWLNDRGHRTRPGRPWSHTAVLTVLRNRTYIGEIYFRGQHYEAPHPQLVDRDLFDRVQELLAGRGESLAVRAGNSSDYLATGKLRCGRCNKRYVGAAAHGSHGRYRYYICSSRQRYGPGTCPSDRVAADELEHALIDALLTTLERTDLIERAAATLAAQLTGHRSQFQAQLNSIEKELRRTQKAIERYMLGFEEGRLDLDRFGPRVEELALAAKKLEKSRRSLLAALDEAGVAAPAPPVLASIRLRLREALDVEQAVPAMKALIAAMFRKSRFAAGTRSIRRSGCQQRRPPRRTFERCPIKSTDPYIVRTPLPGAGNWHRSTGEVASRPADVHVIPWSLTPGLGPGSRGPGGPGGRPPAWGSVPRTPRPGPDQRTPGWWWLDVHQVRDQLQL